MVGYSYPLQQESESSTQRRHQLIVAAKQAIAEAARTYNAHTVDAAAQLAEYESVLSQQNTHYFDLQQQLLESEAQLAQAGQENRQLLQVMQEEFRQAEERVSKAKLAPLVSRYDNNTCFCTRLYGMYGVFGISFHRFFVPHSLFRVLRVYSKLNLNHFIFMPDTLKGGSIPTCCRTKITTS